MVEITPEIQAQLDEQKKQCIFCKIVAGEMKSSKVYEDDAMLGILDINPAVKGHILFLPKEHYPIMPYLPGDVFAHFFGKMPLLCGGLKRAMLATGANIFIANGGIAGQQAPHFLVHLMAREKGDKLDKYDFSSPKTLDAAKQEQVIKMLAQNFPLMMRNHFKRHPADWHTGLGERPERLKDVQNVVYEDELVLACVPAAAQSLGHIVLYSKEEEKDFSKLRDDSAAHLFFAASFAATAVFEGLGAQGSNIILKTGASNDNKKGELSVHILARYQDDGLDVLWTPMASKPDLAQIAKKIEDEFWYVKKGVDRSKKPKVVDVEAQDVEVYNLDDLEAGREEDEEPDKEKKKTSPTPEDEVSEAIKNLRRTP